MKRLIFVLLVAMLGLLLNPYQAFAGLCNLDSSPGNNCRGNWLMPIACLQQVTNLPLCCQDAPSCTSANGQVVGGVVTPYDPTCGGDEDHVKTALGCLPVTIEILFNPSGGGLMRWAIGIGAGVAFLLGIYGTLMIIISAGEPEKMQAGKELITSAIAGLLLIIFAVMLLQVVGVNILGLF